MISETPCIVSCSSCSRWSVTVRFNSGSVFLYLNFYCYIPTYLNKIGVAYFAQNFESIKINRQSSTSGPQCYLDWICLTSCARKVSDQFHGYIASFVFLSFSGLLENRSVFSRFFALSVTSFSRASVALFMYLYKKGPCYRLHSQTISSSDVENVGVDRSVKRHGICPQCWENAYHSV